MNFFKKLKLNAAVSAIVTLIVGIVFCVNPQGSSEFLALFAGILVIIAGVFDLFIYLKNSGNPFVTHNELLTGVLKLIIGVFMFTHTETIITLISYIFSIYVIIDGIRNFDNSITLKKVNAGGWFINMILSLLLAAAGIVMLFNPMETAGTAVVWMGVILIIDALSAIFTLIRLKQFGNEIRREFKAVQDEIDGNIIDVEAKER